MTIYRSNLRSISSTIEAKLKLANHVFLRQDESLTKKTCFAAEFAHPRYFYSISSELLTGPAREYRHTAFSTHSNKNTTEEAFHTAEERKSSNSLRKATKQTSLTTYSKASNKETKTESLIRKPVLLVIY
jgi:hypothetical protein